MQRYSFHLVVLLMILISLCSFTSCKNASDYINGGEVSIVDPSFDTATGDEKELINVSIEIDNYEFMMIPQFSEPLTGTPIYGSTKGKGKGGSDYIEIDPKGMNSIGYYTQGLWTFGLKAYYKGALIYSVYKDTVEINGNNTKISISPDEIQYSDSAPNSTVYLNEFDLLLVDSFDKYLAGEDYLIKYLISPVSTGGTRIEETVIDLSALSDGVTVTNDVLRINGLKLSGENGLTAGSYVLSVYFYQKKDGVLTKDGGTSYGFTAVPGATLSISLKEDIDLYPNRFKSVGTSGSGIIIDSGIGSSVSIEAWKVVEGATPEFSSNVTVAINEAVKFKSVITNGPSSVTAYKWFIDGVEQISTAIDTNGYLTFTPSTSKTYTITYMFIDGTSYNSISGNYYLTVTSSTTS